MGGRHLRFWSWHPQKHEWCFSDKDKLCSRRQAHHSAWNLKVGASIKAAVLRKPHPACWRSLSRCCSLWFWRARVYMRACEEEVVITSCHAQLSSASWFGINAHTFIWHQFFEFPYPQLFQLAWARSLLSSSGTATTPQPPNPWITYRWPQPRGRKPEGGYLGASFTHLPMIYTYGSCPILWWSQTEPFNFSFPLSSFFSLSLFCPVARRCSFWDFPVDLCFLNLGCLFASPCIKHATFRQSLPLRSSIFQVFQRIRNAWSARARSPHLTLMYTRLTSMCTQ